MRDRDITTPGVVIGSPTTTSVERDHRWAIVLAGGNGTRLGSLTRDERGCIVPKQFCSLLGDRSLPGRSLLGDAMLRAAALAPEQQILVVVTSEHEEYWRREFGNDSSQLVVQSQNRGTTAGVLLPLLTVMQRDPGAVVTLLPSDHFVADEWTLAEALRAARRAAVAEPNRVILLGIEPDSVETDYGWILPERAVGPQCDTTAATLPITAFVEKPDRATATALWARGAVWNSFLVVAQAAAMLELYRRRLPAMLRAFATAHDTSPSDLSSLYAHMNASDFSRHVLAGSAQQLGVRIAPACGWTDLGTPERVARCLATMGPHGSGPRTGTQQNLAGMAQQRVPS